MDTDLKYTKKTMKSYNTNDMAGWIPKESMKTGGTQVSTREMRFGGL